MSSVYLCGPIAGKTYGEATDWREEAIEVLTGMGYDVYSPMREKHELKDQFDNMPLDPTADLHMGGPFGRDVFDIDRSGIVLANLLEMDVPSIGSVWEMGYAFAKEKFIILVIQPWEELGSPKAGTEDYHPFLSGGASRGTIVHSIEAAYVVLRAIQPMVQGQVINVGTPIEELPDMYPELYELGYDGSGDDGVDDSEGTGE